MKKILSLLFCTVIIVGVFAACHSDKEEASATVLDTISYTYDSAYAFDDITTRAYTDLCKAVVNTEGEVRINPGVFDDTMQLFYTSFPLNALVDKIEATSGAYKISYKNAETAHSDTLDFIEKVHNVYENAEESDAVKAVKIYNKIASSIKVSENSAINCYETVMKGEGTSYSYSNMFEYVLQQNGINAYHVLCETESGVSKAISAAEFGGELFYFDLFAEYEDNGGKLLKYFGMTTEDVKNYGIKSMIYTNKQTADDASNLRFEACRNCKAFEIKGSELTVTKNDGNIVQVAL